MGDFDRLLEPIKIGTRTWKNRMVKGPSSTLFAGPDQMCNDTIIGPYKAIAKGGAAAIIIGAMLSDDPKMLIDKETDTEYPYGYRGYPFLGLYDDKFIDPLKKLTSAVHQYGCEIIGQIFQNAAALETKGGAWCASSFSADELPSPVPYCFPTRALTIDEIHAYRDRYIDAAERAQKAGFDGVEVHAANGYLILSFCSRVWNHRDDEYGPQSIENRTRLAREIIAGIRERCGSDFIIGIRMNGQEFCHPDAITMEEGVELAQAFDQAGVDYISVTGYGYGKTPFQYAADFWQYPEVRKDMAQYADRLPQNGGDGLVIPPAAEIKKHVNAPVFGVGSLTPERAERLIEEDKIDLALFSRAPWADPDMFNKVKEGRPEDIRRCNHCGTCDWIRPGHQKACRVNPAFGREAELTPQPTDHPKNVLVIGGGAAGLEAARTAAERGHTVTLYEKEPQLAMELKLATMVKGTASEDVPALINWLTTQAEKQPNLTIKTKTEVTPKLIQKMNPDVIIVATGGHYPTPNVPGIDSKIVSTVPDLAKIAFKAMRFFSADSMNKLSSIALPGIGKNCVVLGGQIEAIQGAVFLRKRGKNVTVLEDSDQIGLRYPPRYLNASLDWLAAHDVSIHKGVTYDSIDKKGITYTENGEQKRLDADTIMVFKSPVEDHTLYDQVKDLAPETYAIGACNGADTSVMVEALRQGREVGCRI